MNPVARLREFGQSVYVDEIRRSWLDDGTLQRFVDRDGIRGVTSNPAIFEASIARTHDYDEAIVRLAHDGRTVDEIYEELVVEDIARAADVFRPQWDASGGRYGWVSLEVSPHLAHDAAGTVREARHLFDRVGRPNVFIKVPGTAAAIPAITTLLASGIPVNVTLLFSVERYEAVHDAYLTAMESRRSNGLAPDVASVASFFLSRIDVAVDPVLERAASRGSLAESARRALGRIAVDNAKIAYAAWQGATSTDRWSSLEAAGARPQRLLWASTGTKNPAYSPLMYVEPLIGSETVTTLPTSTLDAYRDGGDPRATLTDDLDEARERIAALTKIGIDLDEVTATLEEEGVAKFVTPFTSLMATLEASVDRARSH